ncbi:MAG: hypothetical protein H0U57_11650 [Tatlockia sp.]|nr:hypothetical protein [Tatlockia sp.]
MNENTYKGTKVQSGDKFGLAGYWINIDQTHPIRMIYEPDPEIVVPKITETLIFIYFGESKPTALEISALLAEFFPHPKEKI